MNSAIGEPDGSPPGPSSGPGRAGLASTARRSANRARRALKMAAMGRSQADAALVASFYRRSSSRLDKPRAYTGTGQELAPLVFVIGTRRETLVEQDKQQYGKPLRQRSIAALERRAAALRAAVLRTLAHA